MVNTRHLNRCQPESSAFSRWHKGILAEALATVLLRVKGYRILERRVRTAMGEIDIAAQHKRTLVIVEVKFRRFVDRAQCAISAPQQRRLERAALVLLRRYGQRQKMDCVRFDAILMAPWRWPRHIVGAWRSKC